MDDQQMKDQMRGDRILAAITEVNRNRPPVSFRDGIIYCPTNKDFWREVAQRLRIEGDS